MAFLKELEFFFFYKKIILYIEKVKVKFSQNFWLMISTLKKIKQIYKDRNGSKVTGLGLIQNFSGCPERDTSCRGCHSGPRSCHQSVETSTTTQEPEGPLGASNLIKSEQYCSLSFSHLSHWIYRPQL